MWSSEIRKNCRKIPTGLPCPKGEVLLGSIQGQLSDGKWENSPMMEGYWKFLDIDDEGGDVSILISNVGHIWQYGYTRVIPNRFIGMSDAQILKRFADWIRQVAKDEEEY